VRWKHQLREIFGSMSLDITTRPYTNVRVTRCHQITLFLNTKETLAAKRIQGVTLGKPKGTIQKSKFDKNREKIKELLKVGLSVQKITKLLGYQNHTALNTYINKRKLQYS
jgi:hypothetical protein